MLTKEETKKINDFVHSKPRTIQEVSHLLKINWRTADRHVEKISQEEGTISTRTFREGTRGALKIVFWNNIEKIYSSELQERLLRKIEAGRTKTEFSPFDIYQYVHESKRNAFLEEQEEDTKYTEQDLFAQLDAAEKQVLIFSGNFSWVNLIQNKKSFIKLLEDIGSRNVAVKVLANIDINSLKNIKEALAINERLGKSFIDIRHAEQPIRAFIVDNKIIRLKEMKNPDSQRKDEKKRMHIFYEIFDQDWIEWSQKLFLHFFRTAIPANKRIQDLESIHRLKKLS